MVDMKRMRESYDEQQKGGGDFLSFDKGETMVLILPPCVVDDDSPPTAGLPYVPITIHYSVGEKNAMAASLDPEINPIIEHPIVKRYLKKAKKRITGECPIKDAMSGSSLSDDDLDEMRAQTKYLWGMVVIKKRGSSREEWQKVAPKPVPAMIGKQIYDGIMEAFFDHEDITDFDGAIALIIKKEGEKRTTKYTVKVDPATLKTPLKVPAKLRALIEKQQKEGGPLDLFQIASNMIKSTSDIQALLEGVETTSDPDDEDDEDLIEDEDEEEAPPPPKKPAKKVVKKTSKKPEPDDEDDEDLIEDEEDDEDEEEAPPPAKKTAAKKTAKKVVKKTSKKPEPDDEDDEDDLGLDDLEDALEELDDDD